MKSCTSKQIIEKIGVLPPITHPPVCHGYSYSPGRNPKQENVEFILPPRPLVTTSVLICLWLRLSMDCSLGYQQKPKHNIREKKCHEKYGALSYHGK
jgi:hypothetical protein